MTWLLWVRVAGTGSKEKVCDGSSCDSFWLVTMLQESFWSSWSVGREILVKFLCGLIKNSFGSYKVNGVKLGWSSY